MFDVEWERIDVIPVSVRIPGAPWEFWNWESLRDIGNVLGLFIDADMSFTHTKSMTVARILVSLNIRTGLREDLNSIWGQARCKQKLDYEGVPFCCHRCHIYGHLAKNCKQSFGATVDRPESRRWEGAEVIWIYVRTK